MALFPSVEHRVYNYTFLLNTFTALHFEERNDENCGTEVREKMKEFLMDNFNTNGQHNYPMESLQVESEDHVITYEFGPTYTSLRIGRPQYVAFGRSMLPHATRLRMFAFKVLGLERIKQVDVRKISVLPMLVNDIIPTADNVRSMMSKILSDDVLSLVTIQEIDGVPNSVGPLTRHVMEDPDTHFMYEIIIGFLKDQHRENIYNVILDAKCFYAPLQGIVAAEIEDLQSDMSKYLYDFYHWAVKSHVIDIMREGQNNG